MALPIGRRRLAVAVGLRGVEMRSGGAKRDDFGWLAVRCRGAWSGLVLAVSVHVEAMFARRELACFGLDRQTLGRIDKTHLAGRHARRIEQRGLGGCRSL